MSNDVNIEDLMKLMKEVLDKTETSGLKVGIDKEEMEVSIKFSSESVGSHEALSKFATVMAAEASAFVR